jgi:hypothetical protein
MHDDSVARRFGFQGGLVPGVDVFAYMTHMPVAKWGRAFLERGLMDGRFFKPVYDGEIAVVTAEETDGGLAIKVESRGELCATGTASMPSDTPKILLGDFQSVAVVGKTEPASEMSYATGKGSRFRPLRWASRAQPNICATCGKPMRSMRTRRSFTPVCCCGP